MIYFYEWAIKSVIIVSSIIILLNYSKIKQVFQKKQNKEKFILVEEQSFQILINQVRLYKRLSEIQRNQLIQIGDEKNKEIKFKRTKLPRKKEMHLNKRPEYDRMGVCCY